MTKTKRIQLSVFIMFFLCILVTSTILAQGVPSLSDILQKFIESTVPPRGYRVDFVQTILKSELKVERGVSISTQRQISQATFELTYNPSRGPLISEKKTTQLVPPEKPPKPSTAYVKMDMLRFLNDLLAWKESQIMLDTLNRRNFYRISSANNGLSCKLWVDAENWYVYKLILYIHGQKFSETIIEYRWVNDRYWLPSKILMEHSDGTNLTQEFGEYILNVK